MHGAYVEEAFKSFLFIDIPYFIVSEPSGF